MGKLFRFTLCLMAGTLVLCRGTTTFENSPANLEVFSSVNDHPLLKALVNKTYIPEENSSHPSSIDRTAVLATRGSITDAILQSLTSLSSFLIPFVIAAVTLAQSIVTPLLLLFDYLADLPIIQYFVPLPTVILVGQTVLNITSLTLSSLNEENIVSFTNIILNFLYSLFE
ncbi:uncharacterized protein LOC109543173 isoform X1 [Dendroctonus ponderosae]|uniref:uncharacterized protein LOC109543173 isoform X1 n=1 Tax=Dendroctonus ponderosae TaxID=77166 RepID=UPI002035AD1C|nr:uncharacterized protein LOC109543173 isoform X1 [Dendroctonus ponderosae]KAH1013051.1 hypothetical protein HUJ05_012104 [Dendroctonus ponderosae]